MVRVRRSGSAPPTAPAAARSLDGGGSRASNRRASERRSEVTSSSSKASSSKLATAAAQWGTTSARLQSESHADVARGQFEAMMVLGGDSAARDLESAVDLCAGLVQGGMLAGQLENGLVLIDVRGTDVFVGNTRVAPDNLPGWLRGLLRVEAAHNEALARPLQSKLDGMREEGIVADGKEWKEWGHHEEDKGFGAKRPRSDARRGAGGHHGTRTGDERRAASSLEHRGSEAPCDGRC
ncbi:hypothetical protein M885DRAFT_152372 [Pelagophyceae sp. CCMP2097]|nr:hypothetical protein M885DRAFT_152372 [Pelagophyceae sp. CCMP2097]